MTRAEVGERSDRVRSLDREEPSRRPQIIWILGSLAFAMGAAAVACYLLSPEDVAANASLNDVLVALFFGPTGTLLALRRPGNPIGWIFCGMGIASGLSGLGASYGGVALLSNRGTLPLGGLAAWVSSWTWMLGLGATMFLFLLFPTGRYLSRRWFWVGRIGAMAVIALSIIEALLPLSATMPGYPAVNPVAVLSEASVMPVLIVLFLVAVACFILSFAYLIVRFKRSRGAERAQLKWLALAGGTLLLILALSIAGVDQVDNNRLIQTIEVLSAPAAISIAILRYRLYDIDLVINRALVYGP